MLTTCASGPKNIVGVGESKLGFTAVGGASIQKLFVATTRLRSSNAAEFFSGERDHKMNLGNVDVSIPPAHKPGKIEQSSSGRNDVRKHFVIGQPSLFENSNEFLSNLNSELAKRSKGQRSVLIFVHGYNTNFSAALLRITQFVHDTGYQGVPILFTWASRGNTLDYVYDLNSAFQARNYLTDLAVILAGSNAEEFNIVAHSMGNLVTIESMIAVEQSGTTVPKGRLRSVILASPDIDYDLFVEQLKLLKFRKSRFFILVSKDDKALSFSQRIAGGVSRVGATDPAELAKLGVTVLDMSKIQDPDGINHSKFADSPQIVQLIGQGIIGGHTLSTEARTSYTTGQALGSAVSKIVSAPGKLAGGEHGQVLEVNDNYTK